MYTFTLTDKFLTKEEQGIFKAYLDHYGIDDYVWEVFSCLFKAGVKHTKPRLLKVYKDGQLYGTAVIIQCKGYGKSLFNNRLLSGVIDFLGIPFFLWIKFGCCMDMISNPGFVKDPKYADEVFSAMADYLKKHSILTIINDYTKHSRLYPKASVLPALPHALIDTSAMTTVQDYQKGYKNIKKKMRVFENKGGAYIRIDHQLSESQIASLKHCFLSTTEQSVFYLPYQDLYLNAALTTSSTHMENVHYFVATLNGDFLGYQAAIKTGRYLNALHGAFDRQRKTTYHAYDILFVKMTEYAIENELKTIDFGAVLNFTKQKMVNKTADMSYFLLSKYSLIQWLFNTLLKSTKVQGYEQMKFRSDKTSTQDLKIE